MITSSAKYILIFFFLFSCSADKLNLSPVGNSILESRSIGNYPYDSRKNLILYSSEITNLVSTFPKFKNDAVNAEVKTLKYHLKDYIGAMEAYDMNGLFIAQRNFEKSYKKIQKLRKFLNSDDDQVLNRYLVRIKTNMAFLESNISKDSMQVIPKN